MGVRHCSFQPPRTLRRSDRLQSVLIEVNEGDAQIREAFTKAGFAATDEVRAGPETDSVNVVLERA